MYTYIYILHKVNNNNSFHIVLGEKQKSEMNESIACIIYNHNEIFNIFARYQ